MSILFILLGIVLVFAIRALYLFGKEAGRREALMEIKQEKKKNAKRK